LLSKALVENGRFDVKGTQAGFSAPLDGLSHLSTLPDTIICDMNLGEGNALQIGKTLIEQGFLPFHYLFSAV